MEQETKPGTASKIFTLTKKYIANNYDIKNGKVKLNKNSDPISFDTMVMWKGHMHPLGKELTWMFTTEFSHQIDRDRQAALVKKLGELPLPVTYSLLIENTNIVREKYKKLGSTRKAIDPAVDVPPLRKKNGRKPGTPPKKTARQKNLDRIRKLDRSANVKKLKRNGSATPSPKAQPTPRNRSR